MVGEQEARDRDMRDPGDPLQVCLSASRKHDGTPRFGSSVSSGLFSVLNPLSVRLSRTLTISPFCNTAVKILLTKAARKVSFFLFCFALGKKRQLLGAQQDAKKKTHLHDVLRSGCDVVFWQNGTPNCRGALFFSCARLRRQKFLGESDELDAKPRLSSPASGHTHRNRV